MDEISLGIGIFILFVIILLVLTIKVISIDPILNKKRERVYLIGSNKYCKELFANY